MTATRDVGLIPPGAVDEWQALADVLAELDGVPCEDDPERWWPDRKGMDSDVTESAVALCFGCPAVRECGAYAVAAGEPGGLWGALLPEDRKAPDQLIPVPPAHGLRATYAAGCRCRDCTQANALGVAAWRERQAG